MIPGSPPLILTLAIDGESFAYLDGLRRRHFPPERNHVPAHLTLFHALPGEHLRQIQDFLASVCARQPPFALEATKPRSLGRGVAIAFTAPQLVSLRQHLAREWRDWLTPQDSAKIAPHVTIQNKVSPEIAGALMRDLATTFRPFPARADGLQLWTYLGGPWSQAGRFAFRG